MQIGSFYWDIPKTFPALSINSFYFVAFALIVFGLSLIKNYRFRPYILFIANFVFLWSFAQNFYYLIIASLLAIICYSCGLILNKYRYKEVLISGIVIFVSVLLFFKFSNLLKTINVLVPLGLSFYTFKMIAYMVDVYKGKIVVEKNIIYFFDYVLFFPCIMTGPINRPKEFLIELRKRKEFDYKDSKSGGFQMMIGLFEKVVFADYLAYASDLILNNQSIEGTAVLLGIFLYSFNIYLDFDACSNIAIGTARLLGFRLDKNFDSPYLAKNIKEFWRRWHISLSSFFKDYVYIPLGGSKKGVKRTYINIIIIFVFSGLWHGNTANFLIWGLLNGVIWIIEDRITIFEKCQILNPLKIIFNFVLVSILWMIFRCTNINEFFNIIGRLFTSEPTNIKMLGLTINEIYWLCFIVSITIIFDILRNYIDMIYKFNNMFILFRWITYIVLIIMFLIFGMYGGSFDPNDFIYQNF